MRKYFVEVIDEDGFEYIVNLTHIVAVQPAEDFDEYRIYLSDGECLIIRAEEYNKKLKEFVEG